MLIEYAPFGNLLGYLRRSRGLNDTYYKDPDIKPQTNLMSEQLIKFAWQIADGMSYLSSKSVSNQLIAKFFHGVTIGKGLHFPIIHFRWLPFGLSICIFCLHPFLHWGEEGNIFGKFRQTLGIRVFLKRPTRE